MLYILRNAEGYPANHYMVGNHLETGDIEVPMRPDEHHTWNGTAWVLVGTGAATEYARNRKAKYDLLNQDEMRYDDVKNSTTTWVDAIDAIKVAHPKP